MKTDTQPHDPNSKWLTILLLAICFAVLAFCLMRFGDKQPNAGDTMGMQVDTTYEGIDRDTVPGADQ